MEGHRLRDWHTRPLALTEARLSSGLSVPAGMMQCMTDADAASPEFLQQVNELVTSVRAISKAIADPGANLALNLQLGGEAYAHGGLAVVVAAQIAVRRLQQIDRARIAAGLDVLPFPRDELLDVRFLTDPRRAAVGLLETFAAEGPSAEAVNALVTKHGIVGFMQQLQVANAVGVMLAEVDDRFEDLDDLLAKEAIADELEVLGWDQEQS
jgi:hypothetical protein